MPSQSAQRPFSLKLNLSDRFLTVLAGELFDSHLLSPNFLRKAQEFFPLFRPSATSPDRFFQLSYFSSIDQSSAFPVVN